MASAKLARGWRHASPNSFTVASKIRNTIASRLQVKRLIHCLAFHSGISFSVHVLQYRLHHLIPHSGRICKTGLKKLLRALKAIPIGLKIPECHTI
jgi:hypothetical protein